MSLLSLCYLGRRLVFHFVAEAMSTVGGPGGENRTGQSISDRVMAAKFSLAGQGLHRAVAKATTEEPIPPKKKHVDCEFMLSYFGRSYLIISYLPYLTYRPTALPSLPYYQSIHTY